LIASASNFPFLKSTLGSIASFPRSCNNAAILRSYIFSLVILSFFANASAKNITLDECCAVSGSARPTASSTEAIDYAKTLSNIQEQTNYLVGQAKAFYNSKEFQNAIDTSQYVLRYLDKDNPQAKKLLTEAKEAITTHLKQKAEDAKKKFGF